MSKARVLLILGTWVTILPYLGFPSYWKDIFFTITGLGILIFSYVLYREHKKKEDKKNIEKSFDNFKESNNFNENETEEIKPTTGEQ